MDVICSTDIDALTKHKSNVLLYSLYKQSSNKQIGSAGSTLYQAICKAKIDPSQKAWDFLSIALSILAADEGCSRKNSPDGWTRILNVTISVIDTAFWKTQSEALASMLKFLTGDLWTFNFIENNLLLPTIKPQLLKADSVCLLSGGLDSLTGAIDLIAIGRCPILVSQIAKGDKDKQKDFAKAIGDGLIHLQLNHLVRPVGISERSQRGRSLIFFAFGILAASALSKQKPNQKIDLFIPENGFISLNIPLTPLRIGSLSTRTTHPFFIKKLQSILDAASLNISLHNPFQFKTKGEILAECHDQLKLTQLAFLSTSCGRFARTGFKQCGRCLPCLVRRSAINYWGIKDKTDYKYNNLAISDAKHRGFDDVRSVAMAIEQANSKGISRWARASLNTAHLNNNLTDYEKLLTRGISELSNFMQVMEIL